MTKSQRHQRKYSSLLIFVILCFSFMACSQKPHDNTVSFSCNDDSLTQSFSWAVKKALSFAHDGSDPVGYWYEAALPNREAFCMRDVSHQAIGAEILGLSNHNHNMFLKFAANISEQKDYCSYWEINRYDKPAPVDYENDKDFWYNLPANFDVIYNAYRLYEWTGNRDYLNHPDFKMFYKLSLNQYVDHWNLGYDVVERRDRSIHLTDTKNRFGNKRGIPTYNEGGRGETILGIDMTASLIAAYHAYGEILKLSGNEQEARKYIELAQREMDFLNEFWWDQKNKAFRSILYEDNSFDYFMVGENQAFLHYLLYFNAISDQNKINSIVRQYIKNYDSLIVELKSYLPIIFYENGFSMEANNMIKELCSTENHRRDYPENSFTIIEHITRGLMGINALASINTVSTIARLSNQNDWAEIKDVPIFNNNIIVKHDGKNSTTFSNQSGPNLKWKACFAGKHNNLFVNGKKTSSTQTHYDNGESYSFCVIEVDEGEVVTISTGFK